LAAFELGFKIGRKVACDAVIPHLELLRYGNGLALVSEDFGAHSLDRLDPAENSLEDRLRIGRAVAEALVQVHARNVIHKDIKPHNIVMNPETGQVKLIDFGTASQLTREHPSLKSPGKMEGTLNYASPEQSGRMNRSIDSRSDLYSLGVTLYELFCGCLPFTSTDPLALIHAHLARIPVPPHPVDPSVPRAVSAMISKLLNKAPEDRYQTAYGLQRDLDRMLIVLDAGGGLERLGLSRDDVSSRFEVPQKLYGRQAEIDTLLQAYERASSGGRELFLVAGYSGIGKSALVREIYRPITQHRGWFAAGKFDQFRRDIPYAALIAAFRDLVRQVLTESADRLEAVANSLLAALGDNGQVIVDVIPELEAVIGAQPRIADVSPVEAQNRFDHVFRQFIRVFAQAEHPLTLFIDDLQWADIPSLRLLQVLITDKASGHLFVVGAYRDNEGHGLLDTLAAIQAAEQPVHSITLTPLDQETVLTLVPETLRVSPARAQCVGHLVHERSGGNPFFVRELMNTLYREGLLSFDLAGQQWTWDETGFASVEITDNVVELVTGKLASLPADSIEVLKHAACLGSSFDLRTLALVCELGLADTAGALQEALAEGFILPMDDAYKYMSALDAVSERGEDSEMGTAWDRFLHDRVHQAAYALLDEDARQRMHLRAGEILWDAADEEQREVLLMDVANHFDMAKALLNEPEQRQKAARILLAAGRRAVASMAFAPAARLLASALELLPAEPWSAAYELTLDVYTAAAEAEFLNTRYDEMERLIDIVVEHAQTWHAEATVEAVRIKARIASGAHREALDHAFRMLDRVDVVLPRDPQMDDIMAAFQMANTAIGERCAADFTEQPVCAEPDHVLAMELLMSAAPSAYFSQPNNFLIINFHLVKLSVEHGFTVPSIYGYMVFGMLNSGVFGDTVRGYAFGRLAWDLMDRHRAHEQVGRCAMIWGTFVGHWTDHAVDGAQIMYDKFRAAEEVGDLEHATYSVLQALMIEVLAGRNLTELRERYAEPVAWVLQAQQFVGVALVAPFYQQVSNLLDRDRREAYISGDLFDWDKGVAHGHEVGFTMLPAYSSVGQAMSAIVFRDWDLAEKAVAEAEATSDQLTSHYGLACTTFYRSLVLAQQVLSGAESSDELLPRIATNQAQLEQWAQSAPANHRHKHCLVRACTLQIAGEVVASMRAFHEAIRGASDGGFINEEAIAWELLSDLFASEQLPDQASNARQKALSLYARWGAHGKVAQMSVDYPDLAALRAREEGAVGVGGRANTTDTTATITVGDELDLASFVKVGRTISSEIDLQRLLGRVIALVIENAGADRGALLLMDEEGTLQLQAVGQVDQPPEVLQSTPVSEAEGLPRTLVEYCQRTVNNVVLHDAPADRRFGDDPHIQATLPRSVLVAPLNNQGKLTGVVYLENHLSTGVFTERRVDVVEMLCAQAAVSIENSRLYRELREALFAQIALTEAHRRFVPAEFLRTFGRDDITEIVLGESVHREMSCLFSDIRDFSSLAEHLDPTETMAFVNAYMGAVEAPILSNDGFIETYLGDSVIALFESADDAVRAGLGMMEATATLNAHRAGRGEKPVEAGIGINTGMVTLGTIGGINRLKCTVIGDAANLASRVEGLTRMYETPFIISDQTLAALEAPDDFSVRLLDTVRVKGRVTPLRVYEVFDAAPALIKAARLEVAARFDEAICAFYAQQFDTALALLEQCQSVVGSDPVLDRFAQRCTAFIALPPGPDWIGVTDLARK
jgi:predicted ATPase/class 3 adenylate cyclase